MIAIIGELLHIRSDSRSTLNSNQECHVFLLLASVLSLQGHSLKWCLERGTLLDNPVSLCLKHTETVGIT